MLHDYWSTHEYTRRSVEQDVTRFVGFDKLKQLSNLVPDYNKARNQNLFRAIFLTGGRVNEVLELKKENFAIKDDEIIITDMPLEKRYKKTGTYTEWTDEKPKNILKRLYEYDEEKKKFHRKRYNTEKIFEIRKEFRFSTQEPFAQELIEWINKIDQGYLFSGYKPQLSYMTAYRIIDSTGYYPHWLRAQRASCLIVEYGWKMEMMMEWMGWEELSTARHYAKYGPSELVAGKRKT